MEAAGLNPGDPVRLRKTLRMVTGSSPWRRAKPLVYPKRAYCWVTHRLQGHVRLRWPDCPHGYPVLWVKVGEVEPA